MVSGSSVAATGQNIFGIENVKNLAQGKTAWNDPAAVVTAAAFDQAREDDADWWTSISESEGGEITLASGSTASAVHVCGLF